MLIPLPQFTLLHVLLSVAGLVAGLVVLGGFMAGAWYPRWIGTFLVTTVLTNVTGFFFPFTRLLPSHVVGALSLVLLAVALFALHGKRLSGRWRAVFVGTSVAALYFNVFVLLAQLFAKVPAMVVLAPTQREPAFAGTQVVTLVLFVMVGRAAVRGATETVGRVVGMEG